MNDTHVFVLMDALGWPVAEAHGFLADLLPYRRPLRTVLGFSSGAIPSILTGMPPDRHGRWNLLYYNPRASRFRWLRQAQFLPERCLNNRFVRRGLQWLGRHVLQCGPSFECCVRPQLLPWFAWSEDRDLYQPGSLSGARTAFDEWAAAGLDFRIYSYRQGGDLELLRQSAEEIEAGRGSVFFIYLCELDNFLHRFRGQPDAEREFLRRYDGPIRRLCRAVESRGRGLNFHLFSDHGMTPVHRHEDLAGALENLPWRMPRHYLSVLDSTLARFWFFDPRAETDIRAWCRERGCGRILSPQELRDLGLWFPDARYGQLIYLLPPGCMFARSDFHGGAWKPRAMHGYHPADPNSDAVLLSSRPVSSALRDITGVHALLCEPLAGEAQGAGAA